MSPGFRIRAETEAPGVACRLRMRQGPASGHVGAGSSDGSCVLSARSGVILCADKRSPCPEALWRCFEGTLSSPSLIVETGEEGPSLRAEGEASLANRFDPEERRRPRRGQVPRSSGGKRVS